MKPIRILLAKPGLDGHDRGVKVLALGLRDAGFEVLYTGLHRSCEDIVNTALQEDVDVLGVSMLSGGQYAILVRIMQLLKEQNAQDIAVDRKSTRLNSSHTDISRMPSSA